MAPGKPRGGTTRLEGRMTAHHIGMPGPLALAVRRITAGTGKAEGVAAVPSAAPRLGITVRILPMGSEFCTVAITTAIHARSRRFLAAAPQSSGMARAADRKMRNRLRRAAGTSCGPTTGTYSRST